MPDEKTGRLDEEFVVQMKGITKVYPNGVAANQGVDFNLRKGEIHALMGENGAGKSTLMKMLFGLEQPTSGEIWVNGEKLNLFPLCRHLPRHRHGPSALHAGSEPDGRGEHGPRHGAEEGAFYRPRKGS